MRSIVTVAAMALGLGLAGIQTSSAAPVTTTPEATRPPLVLVGTVVGEFRQIGIFVEETTKEAVRLATGEGYDGWVVRSVDKAGVQFERGQLTATVMLRPDKSPGSAAIPTIAVDAAEPPKPVPPPPEATRPPLVLVGTVVGEFRQIGIFVEETTKEPVRLATGEGYDGWVVRSVDKAGVQFERGQLTATVMLRPDKSPGSAAIPTAELIPPVRHRKL